MVWRKERKATEAIQEYCWEELMSYEKKDEEGNILRKATEPDAKKRERCKTACEFLLEVRGDTTLGYL